MFGSKKKLSEKLPTFLNLELTGAIIPQPDVIHVAPSSGVRIANDNGCIFVVQLSKSDTWVYR